MSEEINLKRKLVEATNAVRKKFKQIKAAKVQNMLDLENFYEPISKPLTSISNVVKQQQKPNNTSPQSHSVSVGKTDKILKDPSNESPTQSFETPVAGQKQISTSHYGRHESIFETPSPSNDSTQSHKSSSNTSSNIHSYLSGLRLRPSEYDTTYGVHFGKKTGNKTKTYIGNVEVRFQNGKVSLWKNARNIAIFDGSPELLDLIFLKNPPILNNLREVNKDVLQVYQDILKITDAAYENYDGNLGLRETRLKKYLQIIKPLSLDKKIGSGIKIKNKFKTQLPFKKKLSSKNPEYIYWDKPKELVDRLRLLWSSKMAGHSGHDNEIMSIIEELREAGLIY